MRSATHARVNRNAPEAWGACDRCGFAYNLNRLDYQFEYQGTDLVNLQIRVCPKCMDVPNENLRAITIPPDPRPVADPRPLMTSIGPVPQLTAQQIVGEDE